MSTNPTTTLLPADQRLATINAELSRRNLKQVAKAGDHTLGEFEVIEIIEIYDHSKRFFTDVKFSVLMPDGKQGQFTVRYNANGDAFDGAVLVTLINGKIAIVKQWRLPLGRWTTEVPRGFADKVSSAVTAGNTSTLQLADVPLGIITRELTPDVMAHARLVSVTHLGDIAENSGTHAVEPAFYLVQLEVDEEKLSARLKGTKDLKVQLWDPSKVRPEFGRKLRDMHSITGLALALNHIESLPRI